MDFLGIPDVLELLSRLELVSKEKEALIYCSDTLEFKSFSYGDLIETSTRITCELQCLGAEKSTILVILPTFSYLLPPILLGIIKSSSSFFCVTPGEQLEDICYNYEINFFISDHPPDSILGGRSYVKYHELLVFRERIFICQYRKNEVAQKEQNHIAYVMRTSGSTGTPKCVQVPWTCILPNILSLSKRLHITANDVIYSTSPGTFDPFIVDLLLAFANSATILLTTNRLRVAPTKEFAKLLFLEQSQRQTVTFLQMTPTLLLNFGQDLLKNVVLCPRSSLRICLLGGETFPRKSLLPNTSNKIRFFNIYGITELSCWSHMREVNLDNDEEVDIGEPLDDSIEVQIRERLPKDNFGVLWIGSKARKCILEGEDEKNLASEKILFRNTGDIVEIRNEKYFFRARSNKIIKRFGNQVDLARIEAEAQKVKLIERVQCIFVEEKIILFYQSDEEILNLMDNLRESLKTTEIPDKVFKVEAFPMSSHGKVCEKELLDLYEKINIERKSAVMPQLGVAERFCKLLQELLHSNPSFATSFTNLGGDSVKALRIVGEMKKNYKREFPRLLQMLLDPDTTLHEIGEYLEKSTQLAHYGNSESITTSLRLKFAWRVDLEKCVDATPSIFAGISSSVTIGSHSHKLIAMNVENGKILYEAKLEDRIEGQVAFSEDGFGFVGCYSGFLYKFKIEGQKITWKFDSMAMIKCRPLIISDSVIFGNYSKEKNVWCIHRKSGNLIWSNKIGEKGILANPLRISNEAILIATLDGTVVTLNIKDGTKISEIAFKAPIFSSPTLIKHTDGAESMKILIAEVSGTINILNVRENHISRLGNPFKVSGNVFSSFMQLNLNAESALVAFGCHNSCIYCRGGQPFTD